MLRLAKTAAAADGDLFILAEQCAVTIENTSGMLAAVEETSRIRSHEGRRRHMQYVGKLMRREDVAGIQAIFDEFEQEQLRRDHAFHRLEGLRDRLIDDDEALEPFIVDHPDVDRQALRQLIRNARRERDQEKPPASARKLFKLIRDTAGL